MATYGRQHTRGRYRNLAGKACEVDLSSRELAENRIVFGLLDQLESEGLLSQEQKRRSQVAFYEAITNALEHGNLELKSEWREQEGQRGGDRFTETKAIRLAEPAFADRRINIRLEFDGACLILRVRNEGPGFEPPVMYQAEGEPKEHSYGRGLRLINHFMDVVEFKEGGRLIELRKQLAEHAPRDGDE